MVAVSSYWQLVCVLFILKFNWAYQTAVAEGEGERKISRGEQDDQTGAGGKGGINIGMIFSGYGEDGERASYATEPWSRWPPRELKRPTSQTAC